MKKISQRRLNSVFARVWKIICQADSVPYQTLGFSRVIRTDIGKSQVHNINRIAQNNGRHYNLLIRAIVDDLVVMYQRLPTLKDNIELLFVEGRKARLVNNIICYTIISEYRVRIK